MEAQTQFQKTIGGSGGDYAWSVKQATVGGYTVAGYTDSFGAGGYDFYIVKFAGNTIEWSRAVGGAGIDIALSMVTSIGGGYVIAGETESFGAGNYDAYIVRLDDNGTLLWTKTFGGTGNDYGESIIRTSDGGYAIGGYTNSFGMGDYDMYIAKLDSGGSLQWTRTIGSTGYDYALSIAQTTDGGYVLFGSTAAFGEGYNDFYIAKLGSGGSLEWTRTIGGTGGDYGSYVIQSNDGGYLLAGVTLSFGAGQYDIYIVKLNNSGLLEWTRTIGGADFEYLFSIIQTTDGGYAIAGSTESFGAGGSDEFIVKLNSGGFLQWARTVGGSGEDIARSIIQTSGGYILAGETVSFGSGNYDMFVTMIDSGGYTCGNTFSLLPAAGTGGILGNPVSYTTSPILSVSAPTSSTFTGGILTTLCIVGIQPVSSEIPSQYSLSQNYPNPFNPSTKIKFQVPPLNLPLTGGDREGVLFKIYDILGKDVVTLVNQQLNPGIYEVEWNASNFPSGIYFCKLISNEFSQTIKMMLIK